MSGFVFSEKPIRIERGEGTYLYDDSGTEYLDFGASYAVTPVGHCHPEVVSAAKDQLEELMFVQASYPNDARDACYSKLASVAPGDIENVWLCNSGTEANEAALKFARSATGRKKIVATQRAFHGRTMGSLAATWKQKYKKPFEPLAAGFETVPYGDGEALAEAVDEETAAVIVEPIQGEGGINAAPEGYLQAARETCDETGAALVFDEIQTGLGRTGEFWACEGEGVTPDILTSAKGLASGLPLGATLCKDWIAEDAGPHGSTFSGNPVVCAAAAATLDVLVEEDVPTHAAEMGEYLHEEIEAADLPIRDVRGRGLMTGIEVKRGSNRLLRDLALNHQVLALPAGRSVLRLLPPLVIDEEHVESVVGALAETMSASTES
ncbi:aspartate aminotransferase family protein [Halalkalicoccus jeotgali]|uniref:Putative [LysW]-aminoadipate semialdehyde/glutamate semialdehyde transaminase n=1 Tax=Halalkalicoccus jeotgali (strain DSM 18796 / CECT 7217 / JCM 14584 / KCTC 4019 / B3) TaxID=795797 RepID=D8J507_HALJB|nr:aspartate aminotransferase family protein [Halalkalicoccus jeotgali]ADJ13588.1 acetylornithine aminotransferase [Halalkalicoccus jeotgali B3]ELY33391.1 acetylornithine aminotransferase [Halalkalicoccus jeotgali B3]